MTSSTSEQIRVGDAELVGEFEDGSPEWHEARKEGIGGSDIASILGVSPWKSAYTLWHEKAGLLEPDQPENPLLEWGHRLEPVVADKFAENHPQYAISKAGTWRNIERPWQMANPDRLLYPNTDAPASLLEVKTAMYSSNWEDGVPAHYEAQVRWYMDTFGFEVAHVAVLIGLGDYREFTLHAEPFLADVDRDQARAFMESIDAGNLPEIDGSESTYKTARALNPSIERGAEALIPPEIVTMYTAAADALKEATKADLKAKGHLLAHMGTAQYATDGTDRIASRVAVKDGVPYLKGAK